MFLLDFGTPLQGVEYVLFDLRIGPQTCCSPHAIAMRPNDGSDG